MRNRLIASRFVPKWEGHYISETYKYGNFLIAKHNFEVLLPLNAKWLKLYCT